MHNLPLKGVEARDVWPGNVVELPPSGYKHIRHVLKRLSGREVGDLDFPAASQGQDSNTRRPSSPFLLDFIPLAVLDAVACLDEPRGTESLGHILEILLDLAPRGVQVAPVGIRGEGVLV